MGTSLTAEIAALASFEPSPEDPAGPSSVLQALADAACRLLEADRASLILFDWKARQVDRFLRGGPGWTEVMAAVGFDELAEGLSGWVLRTGEVALSPQDGPDPRESPGVQRRRRETGCGPVLVAPVGTGPRKLGTLTAIRRPGQADFTAQEASDLGLLAAFGAGQIHLARAREAAASAVQSKMNFLSNLSHELRTPLNGILGFSHLLETTTLDPAQKPMVQTILRSGQRLLDTVDNILELAQFEAGQFHLEVAPFSPRQVLDALSAKYGALAAEKGLTWSAEAAPEVPPVFEGDAVRLGQAWGYLASNAVKFTQKGAVRVHLGTRASVRNRTELLLEVSDTGVGLPSSLGTGTRRPFEQGDGSLTRKFGGTGLGLALCDRIVRKMGGGLFLESTPGDGTKALVWVQSGENGQPPEALPGLRVLVQSPDPGGRPDLVGMLERTGHTVDVVRTPGESEARLSSGGYEVLIVDGPGADPAVTEKLARTGAAPHLVALGPPGPPPGPGGPWTAVLFEPLTYPSVVAALDQCYSRRKP